MKKIIIATMTVGLLAGCANDNVKKAELQSVQQQMEKLSQENAALRKQLGQVETSVKEVQGRKFVQLPTGSPTQVESRDTANTAPNNNLADQVEGEGEAGLYQDAMATYKSGDIAGGIVKLKKYREAFPQGKHYDEASYYLAQAFFSERNYDYASQVLSPLVFGKSREQVNVSIAKLLRDVYKASNNAEQLAKLDQLMNPQAIPSEASTTDGVGSAIVTEDGVEVTTPKTTEPTFKSYTP